MAICNGFQIAQRMERQWGLRCLEKVCGRTGGWVTWELGGTWQAELRWGGRDEAKPRPGVVRRELQYSHWQFNNSHEEIRDRMSKYGRQYRVWLRVLTLELDFLDSNPSSTPTSSHFCVCEIRQFTYCFCSSASSSIKLGMIVISIS